MKIDANFNYYNIKVDVHSTCALNFNYYNIKVNVDSTCALTSIYKFTSILIYNLKFLSPTVKSGKI